jgi:hypothetical protein
MGPDLRLVIAKGYGVLDNAIESAAKLRLAKAFIRTFVERVAPPKSLDDSDEAWTQSVRRRFIEICPKGYRSLPSDWITAEDEFLVNHAWIERGERRHILLAGQTEWGTGLYGRAYWHKVKYGLERLLAVKALLKVFVFSSLYESESQDSEIDFSPDFAKNQIEVCLKKYSHHLPGELYVFLDFPQTRRPGRGEYRPYYWLSSAAGRQDPKITTLKVRRLRRPTEFRTQWR